MSLFDRIAPNYDRTNRILSLGLDLRWRKSQAKQMPSDPSFVLLDVATGTGDQIAAWIKAGISYKKIIGIDLSEKMLQIARQKLSFDQDRIFFIEADAAALPFPDQSFDICTCSFGIRNMKKPSKALAEMARVTKTNGLCLVLEFAMPKNCFRPFYLFYIRHVMPYLGSIFTKNIAPYRHLNQTIEQFAPPEVVLDWMKQNGWKNTTGFPMLFGSVVLYRGEKK